MPRWVDGYVNAYVGVQVNKWVGGQVGGWMDRWIIGLDNSDKWVRKVWVCGIFLVFIGDLSSLFVCFF